MYVIMERGREQRMANAISRAAGASRMMHFMWRHVAPYTSMLFGGSNSPSMDPVIILLSPYIGWDDALHNKDDVIRWAAAASAVPYTEEVGRDIVGALLQIARCDSLRTHVPIEIWTWLKKRSTLPPLCHGPGILLTGDMVCHVRGLGDIEVFKSYLLLAWSEHTYPGGTGMIAMEDSLREDFCGIGMWGHRKDLIERLKHILGSRDRRGDYMIYGIGMEYEKLKSVLLEMETEAMNTLTRMLS